MLDFGRDTNSIELRIGGAAGVGGEFIFGLEHTPSLSSSGQLEKLEAEIGIVDNWQSIPGGGTGGGAL
jgi:hypothetical protein